MIIKGLMDSSKAKEYDVRAERIVDVAETKLSRAKSSANSAIENLGKLKLEIYGNDIREFVDTFSKIKNIDFQDSISVDTCRDFGNAPALIKELDSVSLTAMDTLKGMAAGVGAGVLAGWGTYGAVMTLGVASTGTTIASLSGAAATNATLAWLGGGAVAAGGGGIALGSLVLGGLVAAPALLIAGGIIGAKGRESLNNARSNFSAARKFDSDVNAAIKGLEVVQTATEHTKEVLNELKKNAASATSALKTIVSKNTNWSKYSEDDKKTVFASFKTIQILKKTAELPLLTTDGAVTPEIKNLNEYVASLN